VRYGGDLRGYAHRFRVGWRREWTRLSHRNHNITEGLGPPGLHPTAPRTTFRIGTVDIWMENRPWTSAWEQRCLYFYKGGSLGSILPLSTDARVNTPFGFIFAIQPKRLQASPSTTQIRYYVAALKV